MHSRSLRNGTSLVPTLLTTAIVSSCVLCWLNRLNTIVLRPYLDEVFHVRQAQTYWKHQWREWDPKITTPPGLYLVSYLIGALGFLIFRQPKELSASYLRFMNGVVLFSALPILLRRLLSNIWKTPDSLEHERVVSAEKEPGWELHLTVLNISLFPPLFFFSGLYYTDLAAVLIVLEVYRRDLERTSMSDALKDPHSVNHFWNTLFSRQTVLLILFGLVSLLFRQTNIFWTAIFLGGLRVVKTTHSLCVECRSSDIATIARSSWRLRQVYDPPVNMACFEDYLKACLSIGIMAVANIHIMLIALLPYLVLLGAFGLFVLWNGSVVLGHKEFHTASLHLPQMLYIWTYFMFFSWPILIVPWASAIYRAFRSRNGINGIFRSFPRPIIVTFFILLMLLAVHFNTIVHPFTLADNRHYVFYVFRILLRKPFVKYAVTPVYLLCAWAAISAFGAAPSTVSNTESNLTFRQTKKINDSALKRSTMNLSKSDFPANRIRVSFVLIWLASTTLCLITAPLVEPRYFVIPWILWRLHIPPSTYLLHLNRGANRNGTYNKASEQLVRYLPLILEGFWYIAINTVTGYVFLYKGFEWPQEPGQVQRFMW